MLAHPPRFLAILLSIVLAGWSVASVALAVQAAPHVDMADRLGRGESLDRETVIAFRDANRPAGVWSCRQDLIRALAAINLYIAETGGPTDESAIAEAARTVEHSLACQPTDGMAWLQLSLMYGHQFGASADVLRTLDMSFWTAPNELYVMRRRIALASALYASGAAEVGDKLENEIRRVVHSARTDRIAQLYIAAPDSVKPLYERYLSLEPEPRLTKIRKAIERKRPSSAPTP